MTTKLIYIELHTYKEMELPSKLDSVKFSDMLRIPLTTGVSIMRMDLVAVLESFVLENGFLYRKNKDGTSRQVTLVDRGRLVVTFKGKRLFGPDIAWALIHQIEPQWEVVQINGNPLDLNYNNLACARLKRFRFRCTPVPSGFRHPLAKVVHPTRDDCHRDWVNHARRCYQRDMPYIQARQDALKEARAHQFQEDLTQYRSEQAPVVKTRVYATQRVRADRPVPQEGRMWRWYKDQWVSIPNPVHCSDDWRIRAEAVLARPNARFIYDKVLERTVEIGS